MEIFLIVLFFFDFSFLNFVAICYLISMIKLNKLQNEFVGGININDLYTNRDK